MPHREIDLVRRSLASYNATTLAFVADFFHRRLFYLAPDLEALFDPDPRSRVAGFLSFVRGVVADLDRPERVLPRLVALARAAQRAGITAAHYEAARDAMLFALGGALSESFSFELHAAWASAFDRLAGVMLRAVGEAPLLEDRSGDRRPTGRSGTHRIGAPDDADAESAPSSVRAAG